MSLTNRALWVIDRNLGRELSLGSIASACGVSRHHLAHAFGEASGLPVMAYVRGRRLSEAAEALAGGASSILDLALEAGYASHEAFSRAFRAQFAASPEQVRRQGSTEGLALVEPLRTRDAEIAAIAGPRFEQAGEILAVGLREPCSFAAPDAIVAQWRRFGPSFTTIPDLAQPIPIGVMTSVDEDGAFDYVCAGEVTDFSGAPPEFSKLRVPPQSYAVFTHTGHVSTLGQTYAAIWNHWLPQNHLTAADGPGIERHHPSFDPRTGLGGLEVWTPVIG